MVKWWSSFFLIFAQKVWGGGGTGLLGPPTPTGLSIMYKSCAMAIVVQKTAEGWYSNKTGQRNTV